MSARPALGVAAVALAITACTTASPDGESGEDSPAADEPTDELAAGESAPDGVAVELTDADGWMWTVELAKVSTDPDLGADPAPPRYTYFDVEVAITNELADRRTELPAETELFAFVEDGVAAVDWCRTPLREPIESVGEDGEPLDDGCLVAWGGAWADSTARGEVGLDDFDTRAPGDPPRGIAGGGRVRFSLPWLNEAHDRRADHVTVVLAWPATDHMSAEVTTGDATIERGNDYHWVVLSEMSR